MLKRSTARDFKINITALQNNSEQESGDSVSFSNPS